MSDFNHLTPPKSPSEKASEIPSQSINTTIHPALTVTNITNFIKITLDIEKSQYNTWSELFKIHAQTYEVLDHIVPPTETTDASSSPSLKETNPAMWKRLDAIVLQWIYSTISTDLLKTIIEKQEFSKVSMEQFSDASSYCQHIKSLSDQLSNVGAPVSDQPMVLQLVSGLSDAYSHVAAQIRHSETLPLFYKARSMVLLEETALAKRTTHNTNNSAFLTSQENNSNFSSSNHMSRVVEVEVEVDDLTTINKGHGTNQTHNSSGLTLLGLHNGSHGPLLLAHILPLAAMHTLSMAPPDEQWNHIIVDSGHNILVIGRGFSDRDAANEM
ncbi:hypothetical protein TSUD_179130 [Trifolium subterraneum]|uniref:Retrotransposon Copia-like N-terminal domain-containing protein n=1 Tax=Trifolium subterraneum TaxID=3900 RepID=A0A2Z6LL37_TRISU|nr:hypothetical protein TSUD_179130 [Trifolium subterraneum]